VRTKNSWLCSYLTNYSQLFFAVYLRRYVAKEALMKLSLFIILIFVLVYFFINHTKSGCAINDGKWSSTQSYCVTQSCFNSGDCGKWAHPTIWCKELSIGDPIEKVYFKLGNPDSIYGTKYTWQASKATSDVITATINNNTLNSLACPAT
jgi:hypothetical protein